MKIWDTPMLEELDITTTSNTDKYTGSYDDQWAQDESGQWYLLGADSQS